MRIYLDNAATSWPKPETVYRTVDHAQREWGVAAGRGNSREAEQTQRMLNQLRNQIAQLINANRGEEITFHAHGTAALNAAIHGCLQPGDHAICSAADHNSVLRPLHALAQAGTITLTIVPCTSQGWVDPTEIKQAWQPRTRLLALTHASNVTGQIQAVEEVGRLVRERDGLFLLDAAQTIGHLPIDVQQFHCDLLAAPGHKGLLGPLGTGLLYVGPRAEPLIRATIQGGTGTNSESLDQPKALPWRLEPGNLNVPALAGLQAGVQWVSEQTVNKLRAEQLALNRNWQELWQAAELDNMGQLWGAHPQAVGVVSVRFPDYDSHELALILDQLPERIQGRAGLHCAPLLHQALGTASTGGTLRLSWGPLNKPEDLTSTVSGLRMIVTS